MQATAAARVEPSEKGRPGQIRLLGTPAIISDDAVLTLPAKGFAIIALLSAEPGHAHAAASHSRAIMGGVRPGEGQCQSPPDIDAGAPARKAAGCAHSQ